VRRSDQAPRHLGELLEDIGAGQLVRAMKKRVQRASADNGLVRAVSPYAVG
jgi:hypothetical protein